MSWTPAEREVRRPSCLTQVNRAKSVFRLPEALTFVTSQNTLLFICSSTEQLFTAKNDLQQN